VLVEDKAALMRKLGRKQLTLSLQAPLEAVPEGLADLPLELSGDGGTLTYTFDVQKASAPASPACCGGWPSRESTSRTCTRARARSRRSSSTWCGSGRE
jgi:hypothetical protein